MMEKRERDDRDRERTERRGMEHVERLLVLRGVLASGRLRGAGGCSSARTLLSGRYLGVACCRPCAAWSVFKKKKKKWYFPRCIQQLSRRSSAEPRWDSAPAGSRHPHSQRRTQNCTAHSQAQAQPITLSPKALVRAPSEQSKVYERLEESVAKKVNLCAAAASLITGTRMLKPREASHPATAYWR